MRYHKVEGAWKPIQAYYIKVSGAWNEVSGAEFEAYANNIALMFSGYTHSETGATTLGVFGPPAMSGESCSFVAISDNSNVVTSAATWSITNGSSYATVDSMGVVTIHSNANASPITVQAVYAGLTASTNCTITYKSGASAETETTVVVDESGNTTVTTTTENSDGSSTSTSTHYDEDGNETGHENESTDTSGNVSTQTVVKDEQGNDIVTGYVIDTTDNPGGGMPISDGVDTGMLVFDGHDWTATLKVKVLFSNVKTTSPLINLSGHDDETGKLNGVCVFMRKVTSGQGSNCYDENGNKQSTTTSSNPSVGWRISPYNNGSVGTYYDFYHQTGTRAFYTNRFISKSTSMTLVYKIKYTNADHKIEAEIYKEDGTTIVAKPRGEAGVVFSKSLDNVTFEIGKWSNIAGNESTLDMEVLDFHVEKSL